MIDEFEEKIVKYLGECKYVKKMSRKQKMKIKEEINFHPKRNPLMHAFENL